MLALSYKQNKCTVPFIKFLQKSVKLSDCDEINNLTEGQSENVNWYKYRVGRVTASIVHDVIRYRGVSQLAVADVLYCNFVMYLEGLAACKHKINVERIMFDV